MTPLDRAKQFLSNKSRAIALTIVPLAGLAIGQTPARASATDQPLTAFNPAVHPHSEVMLLLQAVLVPTLRNLVPIRVGCSG